MSKKPVNEFYFGPVVQVSNPIKTRSPKGKKSPYAMKKLKDTLGSAGYLPYLESLTADLYKTIAHSQKELDIEKRLRRRGSNRVMSNYDD